MRFSIAEAVHSACAAEGRRNLAYNRRVPWKKDERGTQEEEERAKDEGRRENEHVERDERKRGERWKERERDRDRKGTRAGELGSSCTSMVRYGTTRGKYRRRYPVPPQAGSHTFHGDNI